MSNLNRADAYPSSAEPCPCGDLFIDGVCDACGSCSGCDVRGGPADDSGAAGSPSVAAGTVAYGVTREVVEADRMDYPDHRRVTVQVRYTYPDAPDALLRVVFSQTYGSKPVWMQAGRMEAVMVDDPARFGAFASAPVDWVHSFYADH